jgi:predicted small metal-binding protein
MEYCACGCEHDVADDRVLCSELGCGCDHDFGEEYIKKVKADEDERIEAFTTRGDMSQIHPKPPKWDPNGPKSVCRLCKPPAEIIGDIGRHIKKAHPNGRSAPAHPKG